MCSAPDPSPSALRLSACPVDTLHAPHGGGAPAATLRPVPSPRRPPPSLAGGSRPCLTLSSALLAHPPLLQEDLALIISHTKRRPRVVKEKSPSGYGSG